MFLLEYIFFSFQCANKPRTKHGLKVWGSIFVDNSFILKVGTRSCISSFLVSAVGAPAPALTLRQAGGEEKETQGLNDGAILRDNCELPPAGGN